MLAEDARLLLEHVGWTSNIHVIGHSLGGMIVQRLVLSAPSYFKSMFVISTHMGGFRSCVPCCGMIGLIRVLFSCSRSARLHSMVELLHSKEFLSSRPPIKSSNSTSLPLYSSDVAHSDTGPSHYAQVFQFYDLVEWRGGGPSPVGCLSQTYAAFTHGLSNAEIRALKSSQIPIYIVSGTDDFVVHVRNSRHMARVLSGSYDEFPGVGHSVQTEAAKELNDVLWTGIAQAEGCN
jgi:pimeloyl-ACP methyl ester carboxylesterase